MDTNHVKFVYYSRKERNILSMLLLTLILLWCEVVCSEELDNHILVNGAFSNNHNITVGVENDVSTKNVNDTTEGLQNQFLEQSSGPLHLPIFGQLITQLIRGPFLGSIIRSFLNVLRSSASLRLFDQLTRVIIPEIITVISPTHGLVASLIVGFFTIIFRLIPAVIVFLFNLFVLLPIRTILSPIFLLWLPVRLLIQGIWFLYRVLSLQPKFLVKLRLLRSLITGRPNLRRLRQFLTSASLALRKIWDFFRPSIFARFRLIFQKFISPNLIRLGPRIRNFFLKNRLAIRKFIISVLAALRAIRPTQLIRIWLIIKNVFSFLRTIRPFPLWQRLLLRSTG
ncbi:hypothetical protein C0J52_13375 [Blattella germanica]|nr:hypothetical protein C0J52_13375 [Blattella germanica]